MNKKKIAFTSIIISTIACVTAVLFSTISPSFELKKSAEATNYQITYNKNNAPDSKISGTSSSTPSGSFTYTPSSTYMPLTYNKVYTSTSGHVSLAIGGSIMSSTGSSSNFSNLNSVTISYSTSNQNVYLRYGFKGEDHQLIASSGQTYQICGNWFQIRNCDLSVIEDLIFTVNYPCSDDISMPTNKYFEEGFNNGTYNKNNLAFDELKEIQTITKSYDTTNGYLNCNFSTQNNYRYGSFMSTISNFTGEYAVSVRLKLNESNNRFMILLGKSNYKHSYTNILSDSSLGTSIEFSNPGKWIRVSGGTQQRIENNVLTIDASTQFVNYTVRRNYVSGSLQIYQNDTLIVTFSDSSYVCDGFISFIAGSDGNAGYVIDGFAIEGPSSNDFDYHFEAGTIGKNLIYYPRGAYTSSVAQSNLNVEFSNGNLSTLYEIKNIDLSIKYKNPSDGRLTVVFGATNPSGKGYRNGNNITTGVVGVMITPTFARVFNESSMTHAEQNYSFGSADNYIEFSISFKGTTLTISSGNDTVLTSEVVSVDGGCVCITAGNTSPATIAFDRIAIKGSTDAGLLPSKQNLTIPAYQSVDIPINQTIGTNNYMTLTSQNSQHFAGQFVYRSLEDSSLVVSEDFYIEPNSTSTEFKQFLDAYRTGINSGTGQKMSVGDFGKFLIKLVVRNLESVSINVKLNYLTASNRDVPANDKMIYLEKDNLKVGIDLATGGTLSYLEKTSFNSKTVDLITKSSKVQIGPGYGSLSGASKKSSHVNLINIYDTGRQIQQSYYASVGGVDGSEAERRQSSGNANGYTRRMSYTADSNGYYWPYNPVQGGDEINNCSQIIDYHVTSDELYCKTRALDWAAGQKDVDRTGNRVTKSYMETWCHIEDGVLIVNNRFIDWNGFTNIDSSVPTHNLELPATYISHPLNNYYAYVGSNPFDDTEMASKANLDIQSNLGSWASGSFKTTNHPENWFAWLNDDVDPFGVAVYIPRTNYYASGRSDASTSTLNSKNYGASNSPMVKNYLYNKEAPNCIYDPCYVANTSYTAPTLNVRMKEYVALSYEYAVAVDTLSNFRQIFKSYYLSGKCANNGLLSWN